MNSILLPLILPALSAILLLFIPKQRKLQRWFSVGSMITQLGVAITLFCRSGFKPDFRYAVGGWNAPYGIEFRSDALSSIFIILSLLVATCVLLFSVDTDNRRREIFGFHPLIHTMIMGVCGSFLTADLFNLFVWFEVTLISSFVLLSLGGVRAQLEGGFKYVAINLIASALFLSGAGLLYAHVGTLNFSDLAVRTQQIPNDPKTSLIYVLILCSFLIKSAIFPVSTWLLSSYHTTSVAVSALFAGISTKIGLYAIWRLNENMTVSLPHGFDQVMIWLGILTMLGSGLGALAQKNLRRVFSFLLVSHLGIVFSAIWLYQGAEERGDLLVVGSFTYLFQHMVAITLLFILAGILEEKAKAVAWREMNGVASARSVVGVAYFIVSMTLIGLPPTIGFSSKYTALYGVVGVGATHVLIAVLATSFITMYMLIRIWTRVFWKPSDSEVEKVRLGLTTTIAVVSLSIVLVLMTGFSASGIDYLNSTLLDQFSGGVH